MDIEIIQIWLPIIKDTVTCLAAGVAAVVAILGLRTWKDQLKGKTQYDLAKRLLGAVYEVREAFAKARNGMVTPEDFSNGRKDTGITNETKLDRGTYLVFMYGVFSRRIQIIDRALADIYTLQFEAETIWGEEVKESLGPLIKCRTTFERIYASNARDKFTFPSEKPFTFFFDVISDWLAAVNQDTFTNQIQAAVKKAEDFLRPHLMT